MQEGTIAIYTTCFGEQFLPQEPERVHTGCKYYCFTDHLTQDDSEVWDMVSWAPSTPSSFSQIQSAKMHKTCPLLFDQHEYSIYVDSTHAPLTCPHCLVGKFLKKSDIAAFRHPRRDCLFEEIKTCIEFEKGNPADLQRQAARYRAEGVDPHAGLWCGTVLIRRHTKAMEELGVRWYNEIEEFSTRDQPSLAYLIWKYKVPICTIPGNVYVNRDFQVSEKIQELEKIMPQTFVNIEGS